MTTQNATRLQRERNSIEKVLKDATKQNLGAPENSYKR